MQPRFLGGPNDYCWGAFLGG